MEEVFGVIWNTDDRWYDDFEAYRARETKGVRVGSEESDKVNKTVDWFMTNWKTDGRVLRTSWKVQWGKGGCTVGEKGESGGRIVKICGNEDGCVVETFQVVCGDDWENLWNGRGRGVDGIRRWMLNHKGVDGLVREDGRR